MNGVFLVFAISFDTCRGLGEVRKNNAECDRKSKGRGGAEQHLTIDGLEGEDGYEERKRRINYEIQIGTLKLKQRRRRYEYE